MNIKKTFFDQKKQLQLVLIMFLSFYLLSVSIFLEIEPTVTSSSASPNAMQAISFSFIDTDGNTHHLQEFSGKPIVVEWAASWCVTCEDTQKAMLQLYPSYKDSVHFMTLSYGGSGDDINDVKDMKDRGPYPWIFGLDHENYAATVQMSPGSLWILNKNLSLAKEWRAQIVSARQIQEVLNSLLPENEREPLITPSNNGFIQTPFYQNPLFIGFGLFILGLSAMIFMLRARNARPSSSTITTLTRNKMKRTEHVIKSLMDALPATPDRNNETARSKKTTHVKPRKLKPRNVKK